MSQPTKLVLNEWEFKNVYIADVPEHITFIDIAQLFEGLGHVGWVDFNHYEHYENVRNVAVVSFDYWYDTEMTRECRNDIKTNGYWNVSWKSHIHFTVRAHGEPTADEYAGAMKILSIEVENHEYLSETPGFWAAEKKADFMEKIGVVCEAARGLADIGTLQRRVAELERELAKKEKMLTAASEEKRQAVAELEMQIWRVSEGLPRYDTWGKPFQVNPNDQPIVWPVPDPSMY